MPESAVARVLLDAAIVSLILASVVQVYADVSGRTLPRFLPPWLARLRTAEPATALSLGGLVLFVAGFVIEMVASGGTAPGGRLVVGIIATIAFLFAGGFVVGGEETDRETEA